MNQTLVISGGTRGIGRAIVKRFAKEGIDIAFTYNKSEEEAQNIEKELKKEYGIKAKGYKLNVLNPKDYKELFSEIDNDFQNIKYFISNAIISGKSVAGGFAPFMRLREKGLTNIYTATVLSFVYGAQEAAKRMEVIGGGSILALSSTGNKVYTPNYAGHGSSKAALEIMVKYAATELGGSGIRVNAISGGPIDTDALRAFPNYEEVKAEVIKRASIKRLGSVEDMADAAFFICSNEAGWISGEVLTIDGRSSFK
ncbi:MAG: enoyl-ACP reductase [Campylobacterales bacterium]